MLQLEYQIDFRDAFRTLRNIYDGVFFVKIMNI